jgi:hypothetical protein
MTNLAAFAVDLYATLSASSSLKKVKKPFQFMATAIPFVLMCIGYALDEDSAGSANSVLNIARFEE